MAVIWGLDLKEMQWGKFKGSYMFNRIYHLRRTKMIVYQIAMILCVISESVGTAALSDYVDEQDGIQTRFGKAAHVQNNDIIGILSYNIFIGIAVATIFGSGFFFDLFWPERHESPSVKMAWRICSVVISIMALADAIGATVIVASHRAYIAGISTALADVYFRENGPPNPVYRKNADAVTSVVILWPGVIATFASTYIMWKSLQHNDQFGPFASSYKTKGEEASLELPATAYKPDTVPANDVPVPLTPSESIPPTARPYAGT
ncbi:hypothetical protein EG329_003679 [Mollisiaceae sp. DMI_Dod_QoI]|nr:hypothetical protein EG329_003679 [Helotiales sp. DMI_Dod_QoI]